MENFSAELHKLRREVRDIKSHFEKLEEGQKDALHNYISEEDATKLLGKSKVWFWRQRKDSKLAYKKLGSRIYYSKDDLFNLFENHK